MRTTWLLLLSIYLLSVLPAGFVAVSAFAQRSIDLSGDASRAALALTLYLVGVPLLLVLFRPRRDRAEAAE